MDITVIIINYFRTYNIPEIIGSIKAQSIPSRIWVWDNSGDFPEEYKKDLDLYVKSSKNMYCHPKFLLAGMVQTRYIFNLDDDVKIIDKDLFQKLIKISGENPDYFIGWDGRIIKDNVICYNDHGADGNYHAGEFVKDIDLTNTGISFYPTKLINNIPINPYFDKEIPMSEIDFRHADDLYYSWHLPKILITKELWVGTGIELMPENNIGLRFGDMQHGSKTKFIQKYKYEIIKRRALKNGSNENIMR